MQPIDQPRQDFDSSATESITLEENSKGTNVKVRVIHREGESDEDWIKRITSIYFRVRGEVARTH